MDGVELGKQDCCWLLDTLADYCDALSAISVYERDPITLNVSNRPSARPLDLRMMAFSSASHTWLLRRLG